MKRNFLQLAIIVATVGLTYSLLSLKRPAPKQDRKIIISLTLPETDILLKALSELPLKESGNLYFNIQQQAQAQLQPAQQKPLPKADSSKKH